MKINCISCGFKIDLDDVYEDYNGIIKCFTCEALLQISTEGGKLNFVKFMATPMTDDVQ
jgi:ribosomal protein S27E